MGIDILNGNNGDDKILAGDSAADIVDGGAGTDSCQSDSIDLLASIEVDVA